MEQTILQSPRPQRHANRVSKALRSISEKKPAHKPPTETASGSREAGPKGLQRVLLHPTFPPRMQLFECCDQPWLKGVWREAYMDGLDFLFKLGGVYQNMHKPYTRWAQEAGHDHVLDLGSGNGGPAATMLKASEKTKMTMPHIILSDLHPDLGSFERLNREFPEKAGYRSDAVDALNLPDTNDTHPRLLSICSAFHHFPPAQAAQLIQNATKHADGLFIMEVFTRNLVTPIQPLFNLLPLMLAPFFARRFSFKKVLISTLIPILPLMIIFDGIISALRSYNEDEFFEMIPPETRETWHWEFGRQRYMGIFSAPYFFGYRKTSPRTTSSNAKVSEAARASEYPSAPRPWEVARWGRLLAGLGVAVTTLLAVLHHPHWLIGTMLVALNLMVTSLTDRCSFRNLLIKLGAREREDLFHPGGKPRRATFQKN